MEFNLDEKIAIIKALEFRLEILATRNVRTVSYPVIEALMQEHLNSERQTLQAIVDKLRESL